MSHTHLRLALIFLCISLITLYPGATHQSANAASANLVWKPYLQQLTDTGLIILWATQTGANPLVHYSADTSYSSSAQGSSRTTAFGVKLHRVELSGLQPDTTYYYKVYTEGEEMLPGELLSFRTAPSTGSDTPFTFIAFGDYGRNTDGQRRLRDQMLRDSFDFILTTGDNAYTVGSYAEFQTNVFGVYQNLFSQVGLFPTPGNHDYYSNNAAPYLDIFELPRNAWRANDAERYYSFDYGNVHFVALDSNAPLRVNDAAAGDDMFDWLRNDLNQTTQPWKIVAFHHPAYSTGLHGSDSDVQTKLIPIFELYGVDLVLNGHDHLYQRSRPLKRGQVTTTGEGGIVYIVSGAGSQASYSCSGSAYWLAISYCSKSYGIYSRLKVNGSTLIVEAVDENGTVLDTYTLKKYLDVPVTGVEISGPTGGLVGVGTPFIASASPITATLPITYFWQATGQSSKTNVGGLTSKIIFTWLQTGTQMITITATNGWGTAMDTYSIAVNPVAATIYLPLILE